MDYKICGLIFVAGSLTSKELGFFKKMLMCDTFRGYDSTGVCAGYHDIQGQPLLKVDKSELEGFDYARTREYSSTVTHSVVTPPTWSGGKETTVTRYPNFVFGHNRAATRGAVNALNAHPFQHGHITLAHNGTLIDQTLLPDHEKFEVDSENVAYSIMKNGAEWTIQNLDGAFALIWHDANEKTVNIIRNDDRPFFLVESVGGDWFGASEELMLRWILTRDKKSSVNIKRCFQVEVGVQYVFDVSAYRAKLVNEIKHELPTFTRYSSYYPSNYNNDKDYDEYYNNWARYTKTYNNSGSSKDYTPIGSESSTASSKEEEANKLLDEFGIKERFYERIMFTSYAFDPYPSNRLRGKLSGCLPDHEEFVDIQAHGVESLVFTEDATYTGQIISVYKDRNTIPTLIVRDVVQVECLCDNSTEAVDSAALKEAFKDFDDTHLTEGDDDIPFDVEGKKQLPDGSFVTREEWDSNPHTVCGHCDHPIAFDDVEEVGEYNGSLVCGQCLSDLQKEAEKEEEAQSGGTFCCQGCAKELPEDLRSKDYELICKDCEEFFSRKNAKATVVELRRTTKTGMSITPDQWSKMNTCGVCKQPIPFSDVESINFYGSRPVCLDCEPKLSIRKHNKGK